jgi:radical SAM superfamily enzyme YgiQ (UPF0313 family)
MTDRTGYDVILFADECSLAHSKPIGVYRLATELRRNGYSVKVIDFFAEWLNDIRSLNSLLTSVIDQQTLFIGFSGTTFTKSTSSDRANITDFSEYFNARSTNIWPTDDTRITVLFSHIKRKFPNIKLVYGGEWTDKKITSLQHSVDFLIQGFGEITVVELANHLKNNTGVKFFPHGNLKVINHNKNADGFDFRNQGATVYESSDIVLPGEMLYLETSRGCMFKCRFCDYPILGRKKAHTAYHKTVDVLSDELKRNYDIAGVTKYSIVDNIFNETTEKLQDILRARDRSGVDISFFAFIRYELLSRFPEQIPLLKELGLTTAGIGIESLHTPSARSVGKGTDSEKVKDILYNLKDQWGDKVRIAGTFIIGLPEDNPETLATWIPWLLDKDCPIHFSYMFPLSFFAGTVFSENPEKYGYSVSENRQTWKNKYWDSAQAEKYALDVRTKYWDSGMAKPCSIEFMSLMSYGYDQDYLMRTPLKQLNYSEIHQKYLTRWDQYRTATFEYEKTRINS